MAREPMRRGPVGERFSANLRDLRVAAGLDQVELSARLEHLGHPIGANSISRLEKGERRADAADLMALAVALGVTTNRLLLTDGADQELVELTPTLSVTARTAWKWARGVHGISDDGTPTFGDVTFEQVNAPDDPPDHTTIREMTEYAPLIDSIHQKLIQAAHEQGVPPRVVYASLRLMELTDRLGLTGSDQREGESS